MGMGATKAQIGRAYLPPGGKGVHALKEESIYEKKQGGRTKSIIEGRIVRLSKGFALKNSSKPPPTERKKSETEAEEKGRRLWTTRKGKPCTTKKNAGRRRKREEKVDFNDLGKKINT